MRLALRAAGPVPRGLAFAIDFSIRGTLYFGAIFLLALAFEERGVALFVLLFFVTEWFYPVLFEVLSNGQTPGKRALGLRVVNDDGTPVGWSSSILRNLLLAADFLPLGYAFGLVSMLIDRSFRRLGDLAAGTLVVHAKAALPARQEVAEVAPLAPPIPLTVEEQRAVIAFAERSPLLSQARAEEIAALATPLHGDGAPRERLLRMAAWLLGRRAAGERP